MNARRSLLSLPLRERFVLCCRGFCSDVFVSPDFTHHIRKGSHMYSQRFASVLSFHYPEGLAAVKEGGSTRRAFHIKENGDAAYDARFERTFGFYQSLAAVVDFDGRWYHISTNGIPAYASRWNWCGNFAKVPPTRGDSSDGDPAAAPSHQLRCTVMRTDDNGHNNSYFYIDSSGEIKCGPYGYAGDFNNHGEAVVLKHSGEWSIIDIDGQEVYMARGKKDSRLLFDGMPPHKGIACVKDEEGWFFIDRFGEEVIQGHARYKEVEPFYNGRSKVRLLNGQRAVIDESGTVITQLPQSPKEIDTDLLKLSMSYWQPLALKMALEMNVLSSLVRNDDVPDSANTERADGRNPLNPPSYCYSHEAVDDAVSAHTSHASASAGAATHSSPLPLSADPKFKSIVLDACAEMEMGLVRKVVSAQPLEPHGSRARPTADGGSLVRDRYILTAKGERLLGRQSDCDSANHSTDTQSGCESSSMIADRVRYWLQDRYLKAWLPTLQHHPKRPLLLTGCQSAAIGIGTATDNTSNQPLLDTFQDLSNDTAAVALSQRVLASYALQDWSGIAGLLPLEDGQRICDIAGGTGSLLREIAASTISNVGSSIKSLTLTCMERPEVVDLARSSNISALPSPLPITFVEGDLFTGPIPKADLYLLSRVLHDWDDQRAVTILRRIHELSPPHAKLCVIDRHATDEDPHAWLSLHMYLLQRAYERTHEEWNALFRQSGWRLMGESSLRSHAVVTLCKDLTSVPTAYSESAPGTTLVDAASDLACGTTAAASKAASMSKTTSVHTSTCQDLNSSGGAVTKAVIPIAGRATRMHPQSNVMPKALLPFFVHRYSNGRRRDDELAIVPALLILLQQLLRPSIVISNENSTNARSFKKAGDRGNSTIQEVYLIVSPQQKALVESFLSSLRWEEGGELTSDPSEYPNYYYCTRCEYFKNPTGAATAGDISNPCVPPPEALDGGGKHSIANRSEGYLGGRVKIVVQPEPCGLGDAVLQAESFVGDSSAFMVVLGDHLYTEGCFEEMLANYDSLYAAATRKQQEQASSMNRSTSSSESNSSIEEVGLTGAVLCSEDEVSSTGLMRLRDMTAVSPTAFPAAARSTTRTNPVATTASAPAVSSGQSSPDESHTGLLPYRGLSWEGLKVTDMIEKPRHRNEYAPFELQTGSKRFMSQLGVDILPRSIFRYLRDEDRRLDAEYSGCSQGPGTNTASTGAARNPGNGGRPELQLRGPMKQFMRSTGELYGCLVGAKRYDLGNPGAYLRSINEFYEDSLPLPTESTAGKRPSKSELLRWLVSPVSPLPVNVKNALLSSAIDGDHDCGRVFIASSPGRVDLMGGIADYSGANVLQCPTSHRTYTLISLHATELPTNTIELHSIHLKSLAQLCECKDTTTSNTVTGSPADSMAPLWSRSVSTDVFFSDPTSNGGNDGRNDRLTDRASLAKALKESQNTKNLADGEADHWPQYIIGVIHALYEKVATSSTLDPSFFEQLKRGATVAVVSDIPTNAGLASSAALELSAVKAAQAALIGICSQAARETGEDADDSGGPNRSSFHIAQALRTLQSMTGEDLALLCHQVENSVVGALCGFMDQVTVAHADENHLLSFSCKSPFNAATLHSLRLPDDLEVWVLNSNEKHDVKGDACRRVRVASLMGKTIINRLRKAAGEAPISHLCDLSVSDFYDPRYRSALPHTMKGSDFLREYGQLEDIDISSEELHTSLLRVGDDDEEYPILSATRHPIEENERVLKFRDTLINYGALEPRARESTLGALMAESHRSYSAVGLGSHYTDLIFHLVSTEISASAAGGVDGRGKDVLLGDAGNFIGERAKLIGAKITGGGSGGTVAVLAKKGSAQLISRVCAGYKSRTGVSCEGTLLCSSFGAQIERRTHYDNENEQLTST